MPDVSTLGDVVEFMTGGFVRLSHVNATLVELGGDGLYVHVRSRDVNKS